MRRTMLRPGLGRLGMACYAVWVALALVTQHATPCPTHDGPGASAVAMAMMPSMSMNAMDGAPAAHAPMHHAGTHAGTHAGSHGAHHACTCVGCGCCVAILDLRTPAETLVPASALVVRGTTAPLAPSRTALPRVDRRLPFANAPPQVMSSAV